jgi:hypothetical protein
MSIDRPPSFTLLADPLWNYSMKRNEDKPKPVLVSMHIN